MVDRATCEQALQSTNCRAFLRIIRQGETNQTPDAYRMINGGALFSDYSKHPYKGLRTTEGGKAAGAYQFLPTTWDGISVQLDLHDFGQASQDLGAIGLIQGRGALDDVLAGRFDEAVAKLRREWTSLPGAAESHAHWSIEKARALYQSYGGKFESNTGLNPPESPVLVSRETTERKPMPAPLLLALAPMLAELIPQIAKLFSSGSEVSTRNVAAVEAVAKTVVTATNSANVQEAIERMQADPAVRDEVQRAVVTDPVIMGLLEVGGGVAKARETGIQMQNATRSFLWNPLFWMSIILLPLASYVVFASVTGGHEQAPWWVGTGISAEAKVGIISSVISLIIGGICGIWFGTSYGSQRKDERAAQ